MAKPNWSCEEVATLGCREVPFEAPDTEKTDGTRNAHGSWGCKQLDLRLPHRQST